MSVDSSNKELYVRIAVGILMLVIFQPIIFTCDTKSASNGDWQILFWFAFILILTAQYSTTPAEFFRGTGIVYIEKLKQWFNNIRGTPDKQTSSDNNHTHKEVGFWTLMPSAFITWIFAKSIQNASSLGASFGVLGSIAYAGWYVSFFSASIVIYYLRTRHNSSSLPGTIEHLYGPIAQVLFCCGLLYRLNNEVWSNALVVAGFYGEVKSGTWWLAAIISSIIPGIYVYLGGMRSSLVSDVLQAGIAVTFLFIILIMISSQGDYDPDYEPEGGWVLESGWQLLSVALIQGTISYPFHDPVLTDRCYLSNPKTMLRSFLVGGFISMAFISLFAVMGIYGASTVGSGSPPLIADYLANNRNLGAGVYTLVNLIFMTSSMSTLDSTFTSTSKILGLDMGGWVPQLRNESENNRSPDELGPLKLNDISTGRVTKKHVIVGRIGIVLMVIVGILPLLEETEALNATLVSGTTVMGLGPPIYLALFWRYGNGGWRRSPLCFIFSFLTGVVYGALYQFWSTEFDTANRDAPFATDLRWGADFGFVGKYTVLLGCNVWGHLLCFVAAAIGFVLDQYVIKFGEFIEMEDAREDSASSSGSGSGKGTQSGGGGAEGNGVTTNGTGGTSVGSIGSIGSADGAPPKAVERVMTVESVDVPV